MRHVWITGAGRGIGAAIAQAFAREGAALSLSGRHLQTLELLRLSMLALSGNLAIKQFPH